MLGHVLGGKNRTQDVYSINFVPVFPVLLVIAGACLGISTLNQDVTVWGFVLRAAPLGIGFGIFQSPNNSAIMGTAPRDQLGVVSGLLALTRTLGQTTGLPLIGALFTVQVFAGKTITPGMIDRASLGAG